MTGCERLMILFGGAKDVGRISQKGAIFHQFLGLCNAPDRPLVEGAALAVLLTDFSVGERISFR